MFINLPSNLEKDSKPTGYSFKIHGKHTKPKATYQNSAYIVSHYM